MPDGTLILTSPTGHRYTSEPAGAQLFPGLGLPAGTSTAQPVTRADVTTPAGNRGLAMPTRKQPRDDDRRRRIERERRARADINTARQLAHARLLDQIEAIDPPPF